MDYNKFNIEEKYDSYKNISRVESEKILLRLEENVDYDRGYDYYILKGKGFVVDNGIRQEVKEGDVILTGNGASHSIENTSNEPLEVLGFILLY